MRFEEDRETHVALRYGKRIKQFLEHFRERFGLRRVLIIILRRMQVAWK